MSPDTTFKIILKDLRDSLDPLTNKPYRVDNSKGEPVPVAFTVGCNFKFGDDLYGDYIVFLRDEPGQEAIGEAAEIVFGLALKSYKMLRTGVRDVPMHQVYVNEAIKPIKVIEPAEEADDGRGEQEVQPAD